MTRKGTKGKQQCLKILLNNLPSPQVVKQKFVVLTNFDETKLDGLRLF